MIANVTDDIVVIQGSMIALDQPAMDAWTSGLRTMLDLEWRSGIWNRSTMEIRSNKLCPKLIFTPWQLPFRPKSVSTMLLMQGKGEGVMLLASLGDF